MSDESFPGAEKLFTAAFALQNPTPELLRLIRAHPTYAAVDELVFYYTEAAEEDPARADALAAALARVRDTPNVPYQGVDGIAGHFSRKLADLHCRGLANEENSGVVDATNLFLINSYLSALSFKYRLSESSDMYGSIQDGLETTASDGQAQSLLIGACIQLLVAGSQIVPDGSSFWSGAADIATKLTAQKKRGLIKDKHIGSFLDVSILNRETFTSVVLLTSMCFFKLTIANAERGFNAEDDVGDLWQKLFPSTSE